MLEYLKTWLNGGDIYAIREMSSPPRVVVGAAPKPAAHSPETPATTPQVSDCSTESARDGMEPVPQENLKIWHQDY